MIGTEWFDAVIIGGGPAGSSCARTLSGAGLRVLVLDRSTFPRNKVCAGWITPTVVTLAEIDLQQYRQGRTLQPIRRFRTGMLGEKMLTTHYNDVISYGILRSEFDNYLLRRSGAELRLGTQVGELEREGAEWLINGAIRTPLLIGAGGHGCPVARRLNPLGKIDTNNSNGHTGEVVVAQEVEFALNASQHARCQVERDTPELYFLPELDGYGWCVRKGDYLNIGLGRTHNQKLGAYVDWFRSYLIEQGRVPADIPATFSGHAYRLASGLATRQVVDDGVMLAGDAAGLAYPQSGEGIRTAIESGILAARTALAAKGDFQRENLQVYARQLHGNYYRSGSETPSRLPRPMRHFLAHLLLSNRYLTRHILLDNWFLHPDRDDEDRFSPSHPTSHGS